MKNCQQFDLDNWSAVENNILVVKVEHTLFDF